MLLPQGSKVQTYAIFVKSDHLLTYCSNESISEGICSVGGVDRGRLTPYYPSKCSESRAESVPLVRTGYLPTKML